MHDNDIHLRFCARFRVRIPIFAGGFLVGMVQIHQLPAGLEERTLLFGVLIFPPTINSDVRCRFYLYLLSRLPLRISRSGYLRYVCSCFMQAGILPRIVQRGGDTCRRNECCMTSYRKGASRTKTRRRSPRVKFTRKLPHVISCSRCPAGQSVTDSKQS